MLLRNSARAALAALATVSMSCVPFRSRPFRVVPGTPNYLLRTPNSHEIPFPDILRTYNGFEPGQNSIDLQPLMQLRIENAYYKPGASRRGLEGFLGTEIAKYEVTAHDLRLLSFHSMNGRPADDVPVQRLISSLQTRHHYYRFYYEVFFKDPSRSHGSVLLGANSIQELNHLSAQLADPETICAPDSEQCTVFPEACSVSIEMEILLNGKRESVVWGIALASVVEGQLRSVQVQRLYAGRLTPVQINAADPKALQLPLLPGDHVSWK